MTEPGRQYPPTAGHGRHALSDVLPAAWTDAAADSGVDGALRGAADWINDRVPKRSAYRPPPRDDGVYREF